MRRARGQLQATWAHSARSATEQLGLRPLGEEGLGLPSPFTGGGTRAPRHGLGEPLHWAPSLDPCSP